MRLYLASTSPARLALLRGAGVEPITIPSRVDEPAVVAAAEAERGQLDASAMVLLLARAKAEAVAEASTAGISSTADGAIDGLILGGDSAFELDGAIYGKPHTPEIATQRLRTQRGRTGVLHSGHWLIDHRGGSTGATLGAVATASVTFADDFSDDEIDAYVASGEPLNVAGAFTIDSLGGPFITRVDGDPSTVVGMSLSTLRELVRGLGVEWPSLWNRL